MGSRYRTVAMYRHAVLVLALAVSAIAENNSTAVNGTASADERIQPHEGWHATPFKSANGATRYFHMSGHKMTFDAAVEYCKPHVETWMDWGAQHVRTSALWCPESEEETDGVLANLFYKPQIEGLDAGLPLPIIMSENTGVWTGVMRDESVVAWSDYKNDYVCRATQEGNSVYPSWNRPASDDMFGANLIEKEDKNPNKKCTITGSVFSTKWYTQDCEAHPTDHNANQFRAMCVSDDEERIAPHANQDYDETLVDEYKRKIDEIRTGIWKAAMITILTITFITTGGFVCCCGFCFFCCCCCCCWPCKKNKSTEIIVQSGANVEAAAPPPMGAAPPMQPGMPMQPMQPGYGMQQPMYAQQPMQQQPAGGINISCNNTNTNTNK